MKLYLPFYISSFILFCLHYFILNNTLSDELIIPLWQVYLFNVFSVTIIYSTLLINQKAELFFNPLYLFLFTTTLKMGGAIIMLSTLFTTENFNLTFEILNFFLIYFIFQFIEIIGLKALLK